MPLAVDITNVEPADGNVSGTDSIAFTVETGVESATVTIIVWVAYAETGATEIVFTGDGFAPRFSASTAVEDSGDVDFTINRVGGWPSSPSFTITAFGEDGSMVQVQRNGTAVGTRTAINFTGNVTASDEPGNDRVNVAVTTGTGAAHSVLGVTGNSSTTRADIASSGGRQVLASNADGTAVAFRSLTAADLVGGAPMDSQEFSADGNWITPTTFTPTLLRIIAYGGGGGAGGGFCGPSGGATGGSGGGGGARREVWLRYADVLAAYPLAASTGVPVTVGAGGAGGLPRIQTTGGAPDQTETPGTAGGTSSFGTLVYAYGGGGGMSTNAAPAGGSGGGCMSPGTTNTAGSGAVIVGGKPNFGTLNTVNGSALGQGGGSAMPSTVLDATLGCADQGGGAGGWSSSTGSISCGSGMSALGGGGGGGAGAGHSSAPTTNNPSAGGGSGPNTLGVPGLGGAAGVSNVTAPTAGTAGIAGNRDHGGTGGGGGGAAGQSGVTTAANGAAGGAGGTHGGGGGGGGAGRNLLPGTATGGAAGAGGRGHVYVDAF